MGNCSQTDDSITWTSKTTTGIDFDIQQTCCYKNENDLRLLLKKRYNYSDLHYDNDAAFNDAFYKNKIDVLKLLISCHPEGQFVIHNCKKFEQYMCDYEEKFDYKTKQTLAYVGSHNNVSFKDNFLHISHIVAIYDAIVSVYGCDSENVKIFEKMHDKKFVDKYQIKELIRYAIKYYSELFINYILSRELFSDAFNYEFKKELFIMVCEYPRCNIMKCLIQHNFLDQLEKKDVHDGLEILSKDRKVYEFGESICEPRRSGFRSISMAPYMYFSRGFCTIDSFGSYRLGNDGPNLNAGFYYGYNSPLIAQELENILAKKQY